MNPENDLCVCLKHQIRFCTACRYGGQEKPKDDTLPENLDTREFMDLEFSKRLKELE